MTGNLVKKGFVVKAFDISPQTLEKCPELGVKPVNSIAEVSQDVWSIESLNSCIG